MSNQGLGIPERAKVGALPRVALILGIASFVFSLLTGIPAIICGVIAQQRIQKDPLRLGGLGFAWAGIICGIVGPLLMGAVITGGLMMYVKNRQAEKVEATTGCLMRMKQLTIAMNLLCEENDGRAPVTGLLFATAKPISPAFDFGVPGESDPQRWRPELGPLHRYIGKELKNPYMCPADDGTRGNPNALTLESNGKIARGGSGRGYWSYSANAVLTPYSPIYDTFKRNNIVVPFVSPVNIYNPNQVKRPGDFILFVEEDSKTSWFDDAGFEPPACASISPINERGVRSWLSDRHDGRGAVAFADGHVELIDAKKFNATPPAPATYWEAMSLETTRQFFPDGGEFVSYLAPPAPPP